MSRVWNRSVLSTAFALLLTSLAAEARAQNTVYVCQHINFEGDCAWVYNSVSSVGGFNDEITSVYVPPGATVKLYQHINFGGEHLELPEGLHPDLRWVYLTSGQSWNDVTSSIEVILAPPAPTQITLLVNGSFNADPPWTAEGSPEFMAVWGTMGSPPQKHRWTQNTDVTYFSGYSGIYAGAWELAWEIANLPPNVDVNVVTHSHGGNVAISATHFLPYFANRPIRHLINLGTPINWQVVRITGGAGVYSHCQASSLADPVQFGGSSTYQIDQYFAHLDYAYAYGELAQEAQANLDWASYYYYSGLADLHFLAAEDWWFSTRIELGDARTYLFTGLSHGDMHEPGVWHALSDVCATN